MGKMVSVMQASISTTLILSSQFSGINNNNQCNLIVSAQETPTESALRTPRNTIFQLPPNQYLESVGNAIPLEGYLRTDGLTILVTSKRKAIWAFGGSGVQAQRFDIDTLEPQQSILNLSPYTNTELGDAIELKTKGYGLALLWSEVIDQTPPNDQIEQTVLYITPSCLSNANNGNSGGNSINPSNIMNEGNRVVLPNTLFPSDLISVLVDRGTDQEKEIIIATFGHEPAIIQAFNLDGSVLPGTIIEIDLKNNIKLMSLDNDNAEFVACYVIGNYDVPGNTEDDINYKCEIYTAQANAQPIVTSTVTPDYDAFEGVHSIAPLGNDRFVTCYTIPEHGSAIDHTAECKIFDHSLGVCGEFSIGTSIPYNDPFVFCVDENHFAVFVDDFETSSTRMYHYDNTQSCTGSDTVTFVGSWLENPDTNVKSAAKLNDKGLFVIGFCEGCNEKSLESHPYSLQVYQMNQRRTYTETFGTNVFQFVWIPTPTDNDDVQIVVTGLSPGTLTPVSPSGGTILYDTGSIFDPVTGKGFYAVATSSSDSDPQTQLTVYDVGSDLSQPKTMTIPEYGTPYLHFFPAQRGMIVCFLTNNCYSFDLVSEFDLTVDPVPPPTESTSAPTGPTVAPTGPTPAPTPSTPAPTDTVGGGDVTGLGVFCRSDSNCPTGTLCDVTTEARGAAQLRRCCNNIGQTCGARSHCCGTAVTCNANGICQFDI